MSRQSRLVYALLVVVVGIGLTFMAGDRGSPRAFAMLFFLFAGSVPLMFFWRNRSASSATDAGDITNANQFRIDKRYLWGIPTFLLMSVSYVAFDFTVDVGRLPGPTELFLNLVQQIAPGSHFGRYHHYVYDDSGILKWQIGPAAQARSPHPLDAAQMGINRLVGRPASTQTRNGRDAGSAWVVYAGNDAQTSKRVYHAKISGEFDASGGAKAPASLEIQTAGTDGSYIVRITLDTVQDCPAAWRLGVRFDGPPAIQIGAGGVAAGAACVLTLQEAGAFVSAVSNARSLVVSLQPAGGSPAQARFAVEGFSLGSP